jgi:hypothetical protein
VTLAVGPGAGLAGRGPGARDGGSLGPRSCEGERGTASSPSPGCAGLVAQVHSANGGGLVAGRTGEHFAASTFAFRYEGHRKRHSGGTDASPAGYMNHQTLPISNHSVHDRHRHVIVRRCFLRSSSVSRRYAPYDRAFGSPKAVIRRSHRYTLRGQGLSFGTRPSFPSRRPTGTQRFFCETPRQSPRPTPVVRQPDVSSV